MNEKQTDMLLNVPGVVKQAKIASNLKQGSESTPYLGVVRVTLSSWCVRGNIDFPLLLNKPHYIDYSWLLTGRESPLHDPKPFDNEKVRREVETIRNSRTTEAVDDRNVTLYNITVAINLKILLSDKHQYALDKTLTPGIPVCDGAIFVNRGSMYPVLKSGDIVGFEGIDNFGNVTYGEMYIAAFHLGEDQYLTVKYVNRSEKEGYVRPINYNPYHEPMDLPMDTIQDMAIVKFSIRKNMMV